MSITCLSSLLNLYTTFLHSWQQFCPPEICNHNSDSRSRQSAQAEAKVVPLFCCQLLSTLGHFPPTPHISLTESTNYHWSLSHSTTSTLLSSLVCSAIPVLYTDRCLIRFIQLQCFQQVWSLDALKPRCIGTNEFSFRPLVPNSCIPNLHSRVNQLVWL